ncbi:hypothetical protein B0H63DRAFT_483972 [Podospora didyma]|uniref:Uncharacterized protein n=1 Tax=Podospora didyma TaxID=330526 RepID=A0AAE0K8N1_9PEZI|nr:hypothetical protein B0H63DRAFT_483972 [Podospora didyma]
MKDNNRIRGRKEKHAYFSLFFHWVIRTEGPKRSRDGIGVSLLFYVCVFFRAKVLNWSGLLDSLVILCVGYYSLLLPSIVWLCIGRGYQTYRHLFVVGCRRRFFYWDFLRF